MVMHAGSVLFNVIVWGAIFVVSKEKKWVGTVLYNQIWDINRIKLLVVNEVFSSHIGEMLLKVKISVII